MQPKHPKPRFAKRPDHGACQWLGRHRSNAADAATKTKASARCRTTTTALITLILLASAACSEPREPVDWPQPMAAKDAFTAALQEYDDHPPRYAAQRMGTTITVQGIVHEFSGPNEAMLVSPEKRLKPISCQTSQPDELADIEIGQAVVATGNMEIPQQQFLPLSACRITSVVTPSQPDRTQRPQQPR